MYGIYRVMGIINTFGKAKALTQARTLFKFNLGSNMNESDIAAIVNYNF